MAEPRVLLDADVPVPLAGILRGRGYDVVHVNDLGLKEWEDPDVFAAGIAMHRTVMTHNVGDYMRLIAEYGQMGRAHFGLIVAEQVRFKLLIFRATKLLAARDAESLRDAVVWLVD